MNKNLNVKIIKIIIAILVISICTGIVIYLFPTIKNLATPEGQLAFKEKTKNAGFLGVLMFLALQIAQIFLFILPGEPLEVLAGMCYGGLWGTVLIMISILLSATLIYLLVKFFGRKFIYDFCSEEQINKLENSKLFKSAENIEFIIFLLFLIPGTPKDLLTYVGCILPINPLKFILISTIARFPSVISSTIAGENLAVANWKMAAIAYSVTFAIVGIIILVIRIFDKNKTTDQVLKNINKEDN